MARRKPWGEGKTGQEGRRDETAPPGPASGRDAAQGLAPSPDPSRPWLLMAAVALWVARPLYPSESAALQGDGLPAVMLWLVLAVIWLFGAIRQPRFRVRWGWVDLALLALVVWHTVSAIWWAGRASPRPAVNMLWEWVGFAGSFFLTRQLLSGPRECRALMAVMCGVAVSLAAFGWYQYVYDLPATRAEYAENPDRYLANAGLWLPPGSPERLTFEKRLASVEPIATFALTNSLAGLLAPWLVVFAGLMVLGRATAATKPSATSPTPTDPGRPRPLDGLVRAGPSVFRSPALRQGLWWAGIVACAGVVAGCLVLTKSRSAFVATALGLAMVGWMWRAGNRRLPWKPIAGAAILAAALVAGTYAVGGLDREVLTEAKKSLGYRGQYWQSSLAMIADHPLLGCGPGNFQCAYTAYKLPEASEEIADPHNFLIEVWATAGTPAMLAFVAALAGFLVVALREPRPACDPNTSASGPNDADRPALVYAGAAAGFLLVLPLSVISPAPPEISLFLVTLPCFGLTLGLLWKHATQGGCTPGLPAVGVAVLLVHLSASGGIGFAGVAGSLWLLMAIGLNLADGWSGRLLPRWTAWVALAVVGPAAWACYATGYGPVLRCQAALERAQRHPLQADQHLLEAAEADPWAMQPWNQLAALAFEAWKAKAHDEKAVRRFVGYTEHLLARAPKCASLWEITGDRFLEMSRRNHEAQYLQQAEKCFRTAVTLYPNSAALRAKLALALRASGNLSGYEEERGQALELDRITPHLDKRLPAELRDALNRS